MSHEPLVLVVEDGVLSRSVLRRHLEAEGFGVTEAEDGLLREVADRLRSGLRSSDVIGRYGGEEFLVIFPSTEIEAACLATARLCGALASQPFVVGLDLEPVVVTASFGVACTLEDPSDRPQLEGLVSSADRRLCEAKAAGRCCIRP